jgi:HD superfamily phosphohydrolase
MEYTPEQAGENNPDKKINTKKSSTNKSKGLPSQSSIAFENTNGYQPPEYKPTNGKDTHTNDTNFRPSLLKPDKVFGIAVCGDVMLNKMEVAIIDTEVYQRMRKIKQLGSTYTVYPSAVHTRFEHSLGVVKKADLIISKIRQNKHNVAGEGEISDELELIIRLMALLHDIGHMPFGHTLEDEFGIFTRHDEHIARWDYFIGKNTEIGKIIVENFTKYYEECDQHQESRGTQPNTDPKERANSLFDRFYNLIICDKKFKTPQLREDAFAYDIVSNTVCADLLDYLERDSTFTGLNMKPHPRFLDFFFIKKITVKEKIYNCDTQKEESTKFTQNRIAIRVFKTGKKELRHDIISELIQLLRFRYYLGERVYYHHTKIKSGTMLSGAVLRAKELGYFDPSAKFMSNKSEDEKKIIRNTGFPESDLIFNIHDMGDDELIYYLKNLDANKVNYNERKAVEAIKELATAYDARDLYKEIIYETKNTLHIDDKYDIASIEAGEPEKARNKLAIHLYDHFIKPGTCKTKMEIEDGICEYLDDMQPGDLLIYCPSFNMAMKLAKMKVVNEDQEDYELWKFPHPAIGEECSSIIHNHQALWAIRVFVKKIFIIESNGDDLNAAGEDLKKRKYVFYDKLIRKYCKWKVFSKPSEEKTSSKEFWKEYINFILWKVENNALQDDEKQLIPVNEQTKSKAANIRQTQVKELAGILSDNTQTYDKKIAVYQAVAEILNG